MRATITTMNAACAANLLKFSIALNAVAIAIATPVNVNQNLHEYQNGDIGIGDTLGLKRLLVNAARRITMNDSVDNLTWSSTPSILFGADGQPECSRSIDEFPTFFTDEQRKQGGIVLPCIIAIYCFTVLAIICDNYFLPCVERICEALNLSRDVAAATFMAMATSAPELFSNIIGTFITKSDIGIGTVVGSSMFNTLGVAAIGGIAARTPIQLDWWPLTRDCSIYICSIVLLVWITWDGQVFWYEALVLFIVYFIYLTVMFQNVRIMAFFRSIQNRISATRVSEESSKGMELSTVTTVTTIDDELNKYIEHKEHKKDKMADKEKRFENGQATINITRSAKDAKDAGTIEEIQSEGNESIFKFPKGHWTTQLLFIYMWPIKLVLFCTVPDCQKHRNVYPLTFVMCVILIALNSYLVSWMVTLIGSTFGIQDSILGLTFLAAGGCLPEAISITITSRKGEGRMGISNSLGANTMNILLSLGLPWFIRTLQLLAQEGSAEAFIAIKSGSLEYTILALILVAITLYVCLSINRFRLSRKSGAILISIYTCFLIGAILSEVYLFQTDCNGLTS